MAEVKSINLANEYKHLKAAEIEFIENSVTIVKLLLQDFINALKQAFEVYLSDETFKYNTKKMTDYAIIYLSNRFAKMLSPSDKTRESLNFTLQSFSINVAESQLIDSYNKLNRVLQSINVKFNIDHSVYLHRIKYVVHDEYGIIKKAAGCDYFDLSDT